MQLASYGFSEYAHVKILTVGGHLNGKTVRRSQSERLENRNELIS